jgi:saccharopine dehydrogenase-like NADP-dependent oxidoreductase
LTIEWYELYMSINISVLGGRGRIGSSVALDLLEHTPARVTITGRAIEAKIPTILQPFGDRVEYLAVELADMQSLLDAIAPADLVIHCAGPFRQQEPVVLRTCIDRGINYVDVSDDRLFTLAALAFDAAAKAAGVTAVINTGVFPGISNSMARQAVEQLDTATDIEISYVVAGSGGAGITVMRTTFLNIQHPFDAWIDGRWQQVKPYTSREIVEFPAPFGRSGVYWFDMPESLTLTQTFPVATVTTKFGSAPDFYNHLTWLTAHVFPKSLMRQPQFIEGLARISHRMTDFTDRFSGTGVAMRVNVKGQKDGKPARYQSTFLHDNAAIATGIGTGSLSALILAGKLDRPGVWPIEQVLTTSQFEEISIGRHLQVAAHWA